MEVVSPALKQAGEPSSEGRTDDISRIHKVTSGGESPAPFQAEIRSLSKEQREQLLQQAQLPVVIPTDHALDMKADLSLPWNKLRIIRRYKLIVL